MVIEVKLEQPSNAEPPILVTLLGIVMDVKREQRKNTSSFRLVTELGITNSVSSLPATSNFLFPYFYTRFFSPVYIPDSASDFSETYDFPPTCKDFLSSL